MNSWKSTINSFISRPIGLSNPNLSSEKLFFLPKSYYVNLESGNKDVKFMSSTNFHINPSNINQQTHLNKQLDEGNSTPIFISTDDQYTRSNNEKIKQNVL